MGLGLSLISEEREEKKTLATASVKKIISKWSSGKGTRLNTRRLCVLSPISNLKARWTTMSPVSCSSKKLVNQFLLQPMDKYSVHLKKVDPALEGKMPRRKNMRNCKKRNKEKSNADIRSMSCHCTEMGGQNPEEMVLIRFADDTELGKLLVP